MKKTKHITLLFSLATTLLSPMIAYAGWPVFQVLTPDEIMQKVITENCPPGEGYIPVGTEFKINSRYIPSDQIWYWVYTGSSQCQKLPDQGQGLQYMFYEQSGRSAGSTITTIYGADKTGPLFNFTFTVPAEPAGWDCGPFSGQEPPVTIGCARDGVKN